MKIEYVLSHCDECGTENRYNHLMTTKKGFSLTFCHDCLCKLKKRIKEYVVAEEEKVSE